ncbi:hypothetical protein YC2023_060625 [Brassica napus]
MEFGYGDVTTKEYGQNKIIDESMETTMEEKMVWSFILWILAKYENCMRWKVNMQKKSDRVLQYLSELLAEKKAKNAAIKQREAIEAFQRGRRLDAIEAQIKERQRKLAEDQRNLLQQQAQAKAQNLPYEYYLARKRLHVTRKTVNIMFNSSKDRTFNEKVFDLELLQMDHEAQRRQISCVFVLLKRILACVPTLSLAPIEAYPAVIFRL